MKLLIYLIVGVLLVTYAWGWSIDVYFGYMNTTRYTAHYLSDVADLMSFAWEGAQNVFSFLAKPLPYRAA